MGKKERREEERGGIKHGEEGRKNVKIISGWATGERERG
jgi:hypothetical protein